MNTCPCCQKKNPIPFRRKMSMGLWSEEKCSFCECRLREHAIIAVVGHLLLSLSVPFGFIGGVEIFQIFFGSKFGLSMGYFIIGGFLGMIIWGIFFLWLVYLFVPFTQVTTDKKNNDYRR